MGLSLPRGGHESHSPVCLRPQSPSALGRVSARVDQAARLFSDSAPCTGSERRGARAQAVMPASAALPSCSCTLVCFYIGSHATENRVLLGNQAPHARLLPNPGNQVGGSVQIFRPLAPDAGDPGQPSDFAQPLLRQVRLSSLALTRRQRALCTAPGQRAGLGREDV